MPLKSVLWGFEVQTSPIISKPQAYDCVSNRGLSKHHLSGGSDLFLSIFNLIVGVDPCINPGGYSDPPLHLGFRERSGRAWVL